MAPLSRYSPVSCRFIGFAIACLAKKQEKNTFLHTRLEAVSEPLLRARLILLAAPYAWRRRERKGMDRQRSLPQAGEERLRTGSEAMNQFLFFLKSRRAGEVELHLMLQSR